MTKDEAILAAARAQRAGMKIFREYDGDTPEVLAAAQEMEDARYQALVLGATSDDILAALSSL